MSPASFTPIWACRASGARPSLTACGLVAPSESHIIGVGATKIVPPLSSTASRLPAWSDFIDRPLVESGNVSSARAPPAAAARDLTTRTWEKPSTSAVTWRSTPGMTSG